MPHVRYEPGQRTEHRGRKRRPEADERVAPHDEQPEHRGRRDQRELGRLPPAEPEHEPERRGVQARRPVAQAQHEQEREQREHERRAVEAVRPHRLPDGVRRPDPEERRRHARGRLADGATSDAPDEQRRDRKEHGRDELERQRRRPEDGEQRRGEKDLEGAAVRLPPVERAQLTVEHVPRHQPPDGLVGVQRAQRRRQQPHPERHSGCDRRPEDDLQQAALAHDGIEPEQEVPCPSDVRDLRTVRATRRRGSGPCGGRRDARRDQAPRPRRRRVDAARALRARPPPPARDRPRDGRAARHGRVRRDRRRLQRRDLQLPGAARGAGRRRDTGCAAPATRRSSPTSTRSTASVSSSGCTACSRSRSGTAAGNGSCSRATASARSRSSGRGSPTARSRSPRS